MSTTSPPADPKDNLTPEEEDDLVVEWVDASAGPELAWPSDWVDATAGSIDDPSFVRPPQGTYETREGIE